MGKNDKIKMQKIIYFDEESVTDYVQIVEGGKLEKTTELLNGTEENLNAKTKTSGSVGISGVFKAILGLESKIGDDPCGAQRHRIAVRDRPRCAAGDLVAQPPARFGQVGDAHGFETVAAELSGAGGEARREVGCFVLHD